MKISFLKEVQITGFLRLYTNSSKEIDFIKMVRCYYERVGDSYDIVAVFDYKGKHIICRQDWLTNII